MRRVASRLWRTAARVTPREHLRYSSYDIRASYCSLARYRIVSFYAKSFAFRLYIYRMNSVADELRISSLSYALLVPTRPLVLALPTK